MKLQIKNSFFETTLLYLVFLVFSFFIMKSFGITMPDDGWRHLAMAVYPDQIQSWGRVYPNTLYGDFDPWFMWHKLLAFIHNFVEISNINIVVNTIVYSLLSLWYYLAFTKFTKFDKLFCILLALTLPILNDRYFFLRPDILSGLFVLYFLIIKNKILLTTISLIYAPFYYIFWFYFAYLGFIKLVQKEYKNMILLTLVGILGFIFYLSYDFNGFIQITQNVLNNDALIQKYSVGESKSFIIPIEIKNQFGSGITLLFLIIFSLLLYFVFKPKNHLFVYFILLLPLLLIQYRFLNLLQPLVYVFLLHIIFTSYKIIENNGFQYFIDIIMKFLKEKSYLGNLSKNTIKGIFIFSIIIFFTLQFSTNKKSYQKLHKNYLQLSFLEDLEFKNKRILFSTMNTSSYMATFINPTGSYIPGCSLGWVTYNEKNKKTYFDLLINNDEISTNDLYFFLKVNFIDYFIIDTSTTSNLKLSTKGLEENGFVFYKIINSKLIFRKIKQNL